MIRRALAGALVAAGLPLVGLVGQVPTASATERLAGVDLLADVDVLEQAFRALHPGLERYNTPEQLARSFADLRATLANGGTLREAYLAISRLAASIRCGHTHTNFVNQTESTQEQLFNGHDKLPFTFRLIDGRMIVTGDATVDRSVLRGTEILSVDGRPVAAIIEGLLPYVAADGSNDGKRHDKLQVTGIGAYEVFDVFHPLVFPPTDGTFHLEVERADATKAELTVEAVTRDTRRVRLDDRLGPQPETVDDLWSFDVWEDGTAYLKVGSFVTWRMDMDWRAFLAGAFDEIRRQELRTLVLDLRGNEGGDDAVRATLRTFLLSRDIEIAPTRQLLRYRSAPNELRPYLDTWDSGFLDRGDAVVETEGGYTFAAASRSRVLRAREDAFQGRAFVLVGPANSSSTFTLASTLKTHGLATLVGRVTGGNQRGINGGQYFFLRLPNSGIEVDVPLIGYYLGPEREDAGLEPDVEVRHSVEALRAGRDLEIETVRQLLRESLR